MSTTAVTPAQAIFRKDYQASAFLVDTIHLQFELVPQATRVTNTMRLCRNPKAALEKNLTFAGENIRLIHVSLNGKMLIPEEYQVTAEALIIFNAPERFEVTVITECDPLNNTALDGLYVSQAMFCTQCEPHGFRKITYYLDRPDVMAKFTTTIVADAKAYPVLLSNGNCIEEKCLNGGLKQVTWQDPFPKPCYLFALVAGDLGCYEDSFVTMSGRKIALKIFVAKGLEAQTRHAMKSLKQAMRWDEENYGREYDLDIFMIVAAADFNMGAMENKGLNIFNAKYILADSETATDTDYEGIASVVAHEYFHNWTGNRITCRDWFQLSLKEGLTVYRDQEFTADITSRPIARIDDVRLLTTRQFVEDAGPLAHPVRPDSYVEMNNFYTMTVYHKGAEVVRMLAALEGQEGFRKGMDQYFAHHDGMAVTCDDFVLAHGDANQRDYTQFLRWYSQAGTPTLQIYDAYDAAKKQYRLTTRQTIASTADGSPKEPMHIPVKVAFIDSTGGMLQTLYHNRKAAEHVLELTAAEQTFVFDDVTSAPIPSLLRDYSAPVKWSYDYSLEAMINLLHHDNDAYNRFHMGREIFYRLFQGGDQQLPSVYLEALRTILLDPALDDAFKARLLSFPGHEELAELQKPIQVRAIIARRQLLVKQIAEFLAWDLQQIYACIPEPNTYHFQAEDVGWRSLRAACLRLLFEAAYPTASQLASDQYQNANNMTDRFNALFCAVSYGDQLHYQLLLDDFYHRYQDNALVMEKWLAVQAMRPQVDTLEQVKTLLLSAVFDYKNPNKVRSLIGAFSSQNFVAFHAPGGVGYEWLAEQVITVDVLNPITAARLVEPLTRWQQYEDGHAVLMRSALQSIALQPQLSKDTKELVMKSL